MNHANIASGFCATGVYPFNQNAIKIPGVPETERCSSPECGLAEASGLAYIPLYSPAPPRNISVSCFSEAEIRRFEIQYENGYDLQHDERYNLWLHLTHTSTSQLVIQDTSSASELDGPDVNSEDRENPLPSRNLVTKFLVIPKPSLEQKKLKSARVLTSQENLQIERERERKE